MLIKCNLSGFNAIEGSFKFKLPWTKFKLPWTKKSLLRVQKQKLMGPNDICLKAHKKHYKEGKF